MELIVSSLGNKVYRRTYGTDKFLTDFPGLTKESAEWLGKKGITSFGVEAVSPGTPGKNNFEVHNVCRDMGFTHIEGLTNLEEVNNACLIAFSPYS